MEFVSYHLADASQCIMVDGQLTGAFPLSHWRGSNIHSHLADDTSAAIVLNAIQQQIPQLNLAQVTANHYDIDGLVGVWSLLHPEEAIKFDVLLRHIALIGDFREVDSDNPQSLQALKIVLALNRLEKELFYPPFGEKQEADACVAKFQTFIPEFTAFLHDTDAYNQWKLDWEETLHGIAMAKQATVKHLSSIRLTVIELAEPLPYYAFTWLAKDSDMILTIYPGNRYELEYRYTTWVDAAKRKVFPRMHPEPLAQILNELENSTHRWMVEDIMDTGPILRLGNETLSRVERFDDPRQRMIQSSSISADILIQTISDYFTSCYEYITPGRFTGWKEIKELANRYSYAKSHRV